MPQTTSEKAGAGMAGAGLFIMVIIIVICMRKRCSRHEDDDTSSSKRASSRAVSWNPDGSYEEDEEEMLKEVLTEEERLWNEIDVEIRALVKSCMLDVKSVVMGRMLGKGTYKVISRMLISYSFVYVKILKAILGAFEKSMKVRSMTSMQVILT